MNKTRSHLLIVGCIALFVAACWGLRFLDNFEYRAYDSFFNLRGEIKPADQIAIVAIDEESIRQLGRWPWSRSVHARLVDLLNAAGARLIMFDVLFTEPDTDHPQADREFGAAITRSGRVVLNSFFTMEGDAPVTLSLPIPVIGEGATIGFANTFAERDGVNRRVPLLLAYDKNVMPSFSLIGVSRWEGKPFDTVVREKKIPLNTYHEMLVNFAGGGFDHNVFPYYSYAAVLNGKYLDQFKDKIVLVGGTATALFDQKAIPFSQIFPGVEIHANTMSNLLRGNFIRPLHWSVTFILIIGFALLAGLVLGRLAPLKGGISALALFIGYFFVAYFLFKCNIYLEFMAPALSLALSYFGVLFYNFKTEEKEKRWIKKTFSHYLSAHVMENILSDPNSLRLGGQRQNLTVLFSDIRGFTTISEALKPEEVVELLNEYLSKMVEVVFRHDGTLDKFIGDAVMAFWGAPLPQQDHSRRAVLCAIEMIEELQKLQEKWRSEGKKIIDIGIGVNTGDMVVGNMGSKDKMEYTIIGDNVNLGSRLEGLNKEFKTRIIIAESTYQAVQDLVEAQPLGAVKVKGKAKAVEIYAVTGRKGAPNTLCAVEKTAPEKKKDDEKKPFDPDIRMEFRQ